MSDLQTLGFGPHWQKQLDAFGNPDCGAARVLEEHKGGYRIMSAHGLLPAVLAGKLRHDAASRLDLPAVGDWVAITQTHDLAVIHGLLPRQSQLIRHAPGEKTDPQIVAANLTTLFVVMALNHDFNLRRLERYLVLAQEGGILPVAVLTKADLALDWEDKQSQAVEVAGDMPVIVTSCRDGRGLTRLWRHLGEGETVALVGSSGAGKSTLTNTLLGEKRQLTQGVRQGDDHGRHTTTSRTLLALPQGGVLLDTPGMRELQLWDGEHGLKETFRDIDDLAKRCRFRDCRHHDEPGCAVQTALMTGELDPKRLASHRKLLRELAHQRVKHDRLAAIEQKRRWKRISRFAEQVQAHKGQT